MYFSLILENESGEQVNLSTTANHNCTAQMIQLCSAFFLKKRRKCVLFRLYQAKTTCCGALSQQAVCIFETTKKR